MATAHFVQSFKMRVVQRGFQRSNIHTPRGRSCSAAMHPPTGMLDRILQWRIEQTPSNEFASESPVLLLIQFGFASLLSSFVCSIALFCFYLLPALRTEVVLTCFLSGLLSFAQRYFMSLLDRHLSFSPWRWFVGAPPLMRRA